MPTTIDVTPSLTAEAHNTISQGLGLANAALVGPSGHAPLAVLAQDADRVQGGLLGYTAWGWLYIERLWVHEADRGGGIGTALLLAAEAEALRRNCPHAWIDTFNPAALRLYQRLGYTAFGSLDGFPPGHTRRFLRKSLMGG